MKIAATISRYLLGLIFLVFGLNGFLRFLPTGPTPAGAAGEFMGALIASHYTVPVFAIQLISAILLLLNRYVPLALTMLAPVLVNILLFHILMAPAGLPPGILCTILWFLVFASVRPAFDGILRAKYN